MRDSWKRLLALVLAAFLFLTAVPVLAEDAAADNAGEDASTADSAGDSAGDSEGDASAGDSAGDPEGDASAGDSAGDSAEGAPLSFQKPEPVNITGPYEFEETNLRIPSRDIELDAILTVPVSDAGKYPMAILTHGFLGDYSDCENLAAYLGKNGVASIRISLMGSGNSGGLYEDSDLDTQADDIVNALHYAQTLDVTDVNNMFLIGKSQGGFDTALAALRVQDEINGVCLWFPAICIPDDFRSGRVMFQEFDVDNIPEKLEMFPGYAVGRKMIEQGMAMNIEEVLPHVEKDVLFIHGDHDTLVDCSYSKEIYTLYPHADLILISGGGHGFDGKNESDALAFTFAFIRTHLLQ